MREILIGTKNPHKQQKLTEIVSPLFHPVLRPELPEVKEDGGSFRQSPKRKAPRMGGGWGALLSQRRGERLPPPSPRPNGSPSIPAASRGPTANASRDFLI